MEAQFKRDQMQGIASTQQQDEGVTLLDCLGYDVPTKTPFLNYTITSANNIIALGG